MVIELNQIWEFPIKEFHPLPRAKLGVGAHDMIGVEAKELGFKRSLLVTTGLRGSGIIEELIGKIEYQGVEVSRPGVSGGFVSGKDETSWQQDRSGTRRN